MRNARVVSQGLLVVGLIAALCTYGLAAQKGQATPGRSQEGSSSSQTAQPQTPSSQTPQSGRAMTLLRTKDLIGKEVKSAQGENLGKIRDIVLTSNYRQVSYVALASEGKLHAIPWQALHVAPNGEITTNVTKAQLTQAPSFTKNDWPSQASSQWQKSSAGAMGSDPNKSPQKKAAEPNTSTGTTSSRTGRTDPSASAAGQGAMGNQAVQMRRVTHLTGMEVKNPQNEDLGDIEGFAIDASNGRVIYDIVAFGGVAGIGEKFAAVPADAVRLEPQTHVAMLNATKKTLESAEFKPSEFASLGTPANEERLSKMFPAAPPSALGYVPPQSPQAQLIADQKAWSESSPHAKAFNPATVRTITGTVESLGMFKPEGAPAGATGGLRLRVMTSSGQSIIVYAGPVTFAEQKDFYVMPGEKITVTGSETKVRNRLVILASELKMGKQTLQLRDKSGKPMWPTGSQGQSQTTQRTR